VAVRREGSEEGEHKRGAARVVRVEGTVGAEQIIEEGESRGVYTEGGPKLYTEGGWLAEISAAPAVAAAICNDTTVPAGIACDTACGGVYTGGGLLTADAATAAAPAPANAAAATRSDQDTTAFAGHAAACDIATVAAATTCHDTTVPARIAACATACNTAATTVAAATAAGTIGHNTDQVLQHDV
jgi:hypothetical protein